MATETRCSHALLVFSLTVLSCR